jgi:LmbE family N-acetylglucosaminyl deacetylase/CheY-like chemotaxis protein
MGESRGRAFAARKSGAPAPAKVLLVEDDHVAALFTVQVLTSHGGFEVSHEADPKAALRAVTPGAWDLMITDIEMPGMTGIELLERVREVDPLLPVVVVTAHVTVGNAVGALRGSADEFLEKPLRPGPLIETVTALVAKGRAARRSGREVVLAIGAHPDDVEIGAGGTLLAHHGAGHRVAILTMTRGARGGLGDTRAGESEAAAAVLGAELFLEDLDDTMVSEGHPTITAMSRVVEQVSPTILYTHSIHDVHQDHRNTHRAAMVAGRGIGRVYCFQSPSATVEFGPSLFVGIDGQLDGKLAAIDAFSSQTAVREYLEPDLISSTARYWSRFAQARYAEAFEVVRDRGAVRAAEPTKAERPPGPEGTEDPHAVS